MVDSQSSKGDSQYLWELLLDIVRSREQNAVVYSEGNRWPSNSLLPESLKLKEVGALFSVIDVGKSNMVGWNQGGCRASGQPHTEVKGISSLQGLQASHIPSFSTEKMCQCPHIFFFSSFPFQERSVKGKASPLTLHPPPPKLRDEPRPHPLLFSQGFSSNNDPFSFLNFSPTSNLKK